MTTPTGPIALSHVQAEFGGSNPISLSEYYRGGTYVNIGTPAGTSGVLIPTSGTISLSEFRGVQSAHIVNPLTLNNMYYSYVTSASRSIWIYFDTNGDLKQYANGVVVNDTSWYAPDPIVGIGSSYWVRATLVTGQTPSSGTLNTWLALTAGRQWTYTASSGIGYSQREGTLLFEVASDSGGSTIVTSKSVSLHVDREF